MLVILILFGAVGCVASEAFGADDCLDISAFGVWGQAIAGVLAAMGALRPLSEALLAASSLLGPRAQLLARALYGLGHLSGMLCLSKPKFTEKYSMPAARGVAENQTQGG